MGRDLQQPADQLRAVDPRPNKQRSGPLPRGKDRLL